MDFGDVHFSKVIILGFKGLLTNEIINDETIPSNLYKYRVTKCEDKDKKYDLRKNKIDDRNYSTFIVNKIIPIGEYNVIFDLDLCNHFAYYIDNSIILGKNCIDYFK